MFQSQLVALVTILSAFTVRAQTNPLTTCQTATGMPTINSTLLEGPWYEAIRAPAKNVSCVTINVNVVNNQTQLNITSKYAPTKNGLVMTKVDRFNVNASYVNANTGFNVSHNNVNVTYKILHIAYDSYVVLCGYTNASDFNTSFGIILTRVRAQNPIKLMQLKSNASQLLPGFNDTTTGNITQSTSCRNSASTSVPALATFFAAFVALLKLAF